MSSKQTSGQESIDAKRARYEQFEFAVCHDGKHVNVRNTTYDEPGHVYTVTVEDREVVQCSCLHHQHRGVRCKHIRAVAAEEIVLAAVDAAGHDDPEPEVRADGGEALESDSKGEAKPYTTHIEPADQGAGRYAKCRGCGREILPVSRFDQLAHANDCPVGNDNANAKE